MPVYYVYILKCTSIKTGVHTLYTGSTQDLMKRVEQHRTGKGARYTKGKHIELGYFETVLSRSAAMKREYEIKTYSVKMKHELLEKFHEMSQK
ncbi:MAG: GIY-YIG nuclease family protein [Promethearchaeota archaeon]